MRMREIFGKKYGKAGGKKRNAAYAGLLAAALLLGGCGQAAGAAAVGESALAASGGNSVAAGESAAAELESETEIAAEQDLSAQDIYEKITESVSLISPVIMQDNFIENYYSIEPAMLKEYVFSMSEEATSAETVVIMKVKDEADIDTIRAALQLVIDEKSGEMEDYLPEQYDIVKKSAVKTKGSYVYLVISEQEEAILRIIEENF